MRLKEYIPIEIKRFILAKIEDRQLNKEKKEFINSLKDRSEEKKIWILDACDHYNLGDQAILMAELEFLKDAFREYKVISIGLKKHDSYILDIKKYVNKDDIIFLHGGGNFGNYYKIAERIRRNIIEMFPNNQIVLFPQTIYFSNDYEGESELLKSIDIYSKHKKLLLVAREKTSYKIMKEKFHNNKVILTPDIVLYLNKCQSKTTRLGALLCCRNDIEGILNEEDKKLLMNALKENYKIVGITDTVGGNNFQAVEEKLDEFRKSEIVITDRIHGMIFATITGTPCIALSNYNYKVKGTYEWIKHLEYIEFTDNIDNVPMLINKLKNIQSTKYDNSFAIRNYEKIIEFINN